MCKLLVHSLEETCAYIGRDEEANDYTVGKLKPVHAPVVSAVSHGALAVTVSGCYSAVDAPGAAPAADRG